MHSIFLSSGGGLVAPAVRRAVALAVLLAGAGFGLAQEGEGSSRAEPGSPEAEARRVAAPFVEKREGFRLREQPWLGELSLERGKAIRVQFFRGHAYQLFAATSKAEGAKGTKVQITVVDAENRVVAQGGGKASAVALEFKPDGTGLYLVLMRVVPDEDEPPGDRRVPVAFLYGYE